MIKSILGTLIGGNGGPPRKNHPLCHETIRWKSDVPLTEGQLRSKRDEFWDTAPAFDGRKEIWDALRAATVAAEALDFQLSQAILDGANISVPNGSVETEQKRNFFKKRGREREKWEEKKSISIKHKCGFEKFKRMGIWVVVNRTKNQLFICCISFPFFLDFSISPLLTIFKYTFYEF